MNVDAVLAGDEPRPGGLLAVHAHPDDETLATGALLATWAESGAPVTLVTCTRGEQGEVIGSDPEQLEGNGPALAAHRETELAAAVAALGVTRQVFLDSLGDAASLGSDDSSDNAASPRIVDSGMVWMPGQRSGTAGAPAIVPPGAFVAVPLEEAARPLADLILRDLPDVVVTYDPAGGYGHPDHVRAHEVTMRAVELVSEILRSGAGNRSIPTAYTGPTVLWASIRPADLRASWHELGKATWVQEVAAAYGLEAPAPDSELPAVASAERKVQVEVEVAPVLDRMLAALRAHATQVHAVQPAPATDLGILACYALSNNVLGAVPRWETYAQAQTPVGGRTVAWPTGVRQVA